MYSPRTPFNFQNKLNFQSEQQCRQHSLYSHKPRYNEPIRIVLEWFTESDWQSKMTAVQNDKPSKFTIYNGSQSETVRKVKFDTFA